MRRLLADKFINDEQFVKMNSIAKRLGVETGYSYNEAYRLISRYAHELLMRNQIDFASLAILTTSVLSTEEKEFLQNLKRCIIGLEKQDNESGENMKVVSKPIKMVAQFLGDGKVKPERWQIANELDENQTIIIDRIRSFEEERVGRVKKYVFECESIVDGLKKIYIIKYDLQNTTWILFKW